MAISPEETYQFINEVFSVMEKKQISREGFREILRTNDFYIKELFNGGLELTLNQMVNISRALNCKLKIELEEV